MYGCERWTRKKVECQRIDASELWCWRRFLRVPWTARRSNQSILKEINTEYSLEGLMLKLKLQNCGHLMQRSQLIREDPDAGKDWSQEKKGMTEEKMVGWHHQLNGHEFEQALGDGEGQGSLACYYPWGHKSWTGLSNWTTTCPLSQCYHPIVPFYPLLSPSPPAFNFSQHQHFFQWGASSHEEAKILELHLQHQSLQWIFRVDFL